MRTPNNLPRHELIGLDIEVTESENDSEVGISGKVVDERKNVLKLETEDDEKTLAKEGRTFSFELPSGKGAKVEGHILVGRPEERIDKRLKKW